MDFRELYESETAYVWKTLRRLGTQDRDLEDLIHEVFVVVAAQLPNFDRTRPVRPWLFGIAFRVLSGYRRSTRRTREELEEVAESLDETPTGEEYVANREAHLMITEALEAIDFDRRGVFIMHELDEMPMSEIATTLSIPSNTAYSRLRLARDEFRAAILRLQARER